MKRVLFFATVLIFGLTACEDLFEPTVPTTGVTLNKTTGALSVGGSETLIATVFPADASNRNVRWSSNNSSVATVNSNGVVSAIAGGMAIITVETVNGSHTATFSVSVVCTSLEGVVINGIRWATRNVDAPGTFATSPERAGMFYQWNRRVGWSSIDPLINSDGNIHWNSSPIERTNWETENSPCPAGWRVPTHSELTSLHTSGSVGVTLNGVDGRLYGTNMPSQIFLPFAGYRNYSRGELKRPYRGHIWASELTSSQWQGLNMFFQSNVSALNASWKNEALNIRCVAN